MSNMWRKDASNQITLGNYVYFFKSPVADMTDCMITAHGGQVVGTDFDLPGGMSLNFLAAYGQSATHKDGPIRSPLGTDRNSGIDSRYAGPRSTCDQLLTKALGTHWKVVANRDGEQYYKFVEATMKSHKARGNWTPHFVSIRNRTYPFSNDAIWLSKVIELVHNHDKKIVNFYSAACRDRLDSDFHLIAKAGPQGVIK
ncbi:MAG: hypothetical protein V4724_11285 [Pseudomonadota bacterium]